MSYEYEKNRVIAKSEKNIDETLGEIIGSTFIDYRKKWNEINNTKNISKFPLYLVLEQRFKCNLKCPMCVISYPEKVSFDTDSSSMSDELFMQIMREANEYNCPSISMNNKHEQRFSFHLAINILGSVHTFHCIRERCKIVTFSRNHVTKKGVDI